MSPTIRTRATLIGTAVVIVLFVAPVPGSSAEPCDEARAARGTPNQGLQVQVDPQTGTYSMPAPGTLVESPARAASATATVVVVTPGLSAAGGFKATLGDDALVHERTE